MLTGKDRGKEGKVLRAFPKTSQVLIEGVNIVKKHQKSRRRGQVGQIVEHPMPLHISNIAIKDPKSGKPARIGYATETKGEKTVKVRVVRPSGEKLK